MFKLKNNVRNIILVLIITISSISFFKLAAEVWEKESVLKYDQIITNWVYSLRAPFLTDFMKIITSFGSTLIIIIFLSIVIAVLILIKKRKYILPLLITLLVNRIFVEIIKFVFARQRPTLSNALVVENSFSFPSGHTIIAITFYGLLIIYLFKISKSNILKVLSILIGILIILGVGFSRIYLGVHWASDVIGSLLIGISWLSFLLLLIENKNKLHSIFKSKTL
jgi:membrane-associated phospholipid phosphatase